jgi:hypothetical protein
VADAPGSGPVPARVLILTYGGTVLNPDRPPVVSHKHSKLGLFAADEVDGLDMPQGYKKSTAAWYGQTSADSPGICAAACGCFASSTRPVRSQQSQLRHASLAAVKSDPGGRSCPLYVRALAGVSRI